MPHIFISYAKKDTRALAESLLRDLNALPGATAWMDTSLAADSSWASQIEGEIDRADYVIVLLSPDVNRKETATTSRSFVLNEIDFAQQERKSILPVMVQRARVPLQLAGIQHIDLTSTPNNPAPVIERVRQRFNIPTLPSPKSAAPASVSPDAASLTTSVGTRHASPAPSNSVLVPRRSLSTMLIGIIVVMAILAGILFFVLPSLTTQNPSTPTLAANSGTPDSRVGYTPVTRNADWTPVEQDFDGVTMVLVPAGCFQMGNDPNGVDGSSSGVPDGGNQCFTAPFWMDKYEVANTQFAAFDGQAALASNTAGDQQPRDNITWFEASDFCAARGGRLPSEREWEYAARGPDALFYPWGNAFDPGFVVYEATSQNRAADVDSHFGGKSWVGAFSLSGNIEEWVNTAYTSVDGGMFAYPYRPDDGREAFTEDPIDRVLRGGSFATSPNIVRSSTRYAQNPTTTNSLVGFRCAKSVTPPAPTLGG